ncbi:SRPBCC family protein [Ferrovibrio sp.]|uniref:SRPBCC family protein n=1 Tax=Ferrovibrio sp. TaxID=1917215 RepID=UPI0035B38999
MSQTATPKPRSALHNTFTITRVYDAPPARVFAAFADPKAKAKWFSPPPDWVDVKQSVEFRVGGREHSSARDSSGVMHVFDSIYYDIVPDARIVYAYDMHLNEKRISVSLTTIDLQAEAGGKTKLTFTEQGVYLDGYDDAKAREEGTTWLLGKLGETL